ncbi:MAG: GNAT family N-acetyltransferase [Clostridiaceae bacterium]
MRNLILVKPSIEYIDEICSYRQEFFDDDGHFNGDSGLRKFEDISAWIEQCRLMEHKETIPKTDWVEADQYMLVCEGEHRILGMINFHHYLNDYLAEYGGHIGFGVRPSERKKGYAKAMLALCLERCRETGLDKVLITCDERNEGSRRTILSCGGVFERTANEGGKKLERYWIILNPLAAYYNNYDEDGRLLSKHGQVEFLTTMRFIERYLTHGAMVIEIGAGTGRYSCAIADMGYSVEAVELFQRNIDIFRSKLKPEQKINITQGNALDLSAFADNNFDVTLLLGPLYHLYTREDKQQSLSEALRVTKPGGIVFVAYCISDGSVVWSGFQRKVFDVAGYIKRGKIDPVTFDTFSVPEDIFELVRKEDIDDLMSGFPVERLHYVATDLFTNYMRGAVDAMSDEEFALYMRYHFAVCERTDMAGVTHHSLDVFRKKV